MHKIYILSLIALCLSCAPKLGSKIISKQEPLTEYAEIVILNEDVNVIPEGIKVGEVSSTDNGFSVNCSYDEIIEPLRNIARQNGANILKITRLKNPDLMSTCVKIYADIYRVDNPQLYESEIIWSPYRKLTWDDFKGKPKDDEFKDFAAVSNCNIGFRSNRVTLLKNAKFYVENKFDCYNSWVKPEALGDDNLLKHEQGHFDIAEIFKRKLESKLASEKVSLTKFEAFAHKALDQIQEEFLKEQELYDLETNYGLDKTNQEEWESKILRLLSL